MRRRIEALLCRPIAGRVERAYQQARRGTKALVHFAVDFVVEADPVQLGEIVERVRDGRLRTNINVSTLDDAIAALNSTERTTGKTIIRVPS